MKRLEQIIVDYEDACNRLYEAVNAAKSELEIDGVIQRFEFCYELCWKTMKLYLEKQGFNCNSPRDTFKEAFKFGLVKDEELWLEMIEDRNHTVHIYSLEISRQIFERVKKNYISRFEDVLHDMKKNM